MGLFRMWLSWQTSPYFFERGFFNYFFAVICLKRFVSNERLLLSVQPVQKFIFMVDSALCFEKLTIPGIVETLQRLCRNIVLYQTKIQRIPRYRATELMSCFQICAIIQMNSFRDYDMNDTPKIQHCRNSNFDDFQGIIILVVMTLMYKR